MASDPEDVEYEDVENTEVVSLGSRLRIVR